TPEDVIRASISFGSTNILEFFEESRNPHNLSFALNGPTQARCRQIVLVIQPVVFADARGDGEGSWCRRGVGIPCLRRYISHSTAPAAYETVLNRVFVKKKKFRQPSLAKPPAQPAPDI